MFTCPLRSILPLLSLILRCEIQEWYGQTCGWAGHDEYVIVVVAGGLWQRLFYILGRRSALNMLQTWFPVADGQWIRVIDNKTVWVVTRGGRQ